MSKIKNSALDQYGAEPFEQQQFGTAGIEGVNFWHSGTLALTAERQSAGMSKIKYDRLDLEGKV